MVDPNSTSRDYPTDQCLHQLVEQQVERTPEAVALVFGAQTLTYRELNARANRLAHHLRALGVGADSLVGVCAERSLEMVVGLLGTLKAGGAYVPLDPEYPKDRLAFMMQDAGVPVLLTQERLAASLPAQGARVVCLDADWERIARESAANPACITRPDQLVYMIYTSGSTGKPKGALNHHRGICNRLLWMQDEYRLSVADRVMQKTPFSFDVSVWEFFWPLLTGARLVLARPGGHRDPAYLVSLIEEQGITVLHFVPSMLQIFLEQPDVERCVTLRDVMCSGEALPYELQEKFFARLRADLHNLYGPTEAAVDVTYWKCERGSSLRIVPIGRPVANTQCHILDVNLQPVPVGEAGELHLGGVQVGYGYHNRPELTAEKFIPDPFRSEARARLYKTGDLARYLPDGAIEYLGRLDHQVKIRGFRIELGEIESCLRKQPGVHDCVVLAREDQPGQKRLVAYLVSATGRAPLVRELRASLQRELPDYMVPAAFVTLEALPLSPNGKIDRKALPAPQATRPALSEVYVAPRSPEEAALAEIWSQVLEVQPVGIHDNYFELGGDSIRVIQMLALARQKGLHFTLEQVFKEQTIEKLAPCIRTSPAESPAAPRLQPFELVAAEDRRKLPAGLEDAYPLVALQAGMYFHSELNPDSAVFHDIFSFEIVAAFDQAKLEASLQQVVSRHATLRTSFDFTRYSEPLQLVHPEARAPLVVEDLRHLTSDEQHEALLAWFAAEKRRPFQWDRAPLARFHVHRYGEQRFQFIVSFHHIIFDGWSLAALLTQIFQDYFSALSGARHSGSPLRTCFREYLALERQAAGSEEHRRFWTEKLTDPTLSTVPRWPKAMCKGGAEQVRCPETIVPAEILAGLRKTARAAGVPLRTVLLVAHMKVMSVVYGHPDVISGVITNGRQEELDAEQMVGLFLNALPLRMKLAGGSWLELCRQTFAAEQDIVPYRRLPLVEVQKLAGGRSLFETSFDFVNWHVYRGLEGYPNCGFKEGHYFEAENFTLSCSFGLDSSSKVLEFHFDYDPAQLPEQQVREYCGYYLNTLVAMSSDPTARYESFSPLSETEKTKLLVDWNQTAVPYPGGNLCLHELIEGQASRTPDAVAVVGGGRTLSYGGLDCRANQLAHALRKRGVGPDVLVGLYVNRTPDMIVALLGVLKAGGAYVPLDPDYPAERLAFMLEDCGAKALITEESLRASLPPLPAVCEVIYLDRDAEALAAERQDAPRPEADLSNLAYAIYTSGSTGQPKAALLTHRGLSSLAVSEMRLYGIGPQSRVLQFASLSFDASLSEIAMALCSGATLYIEGRDALLPGPDLERYLERQKITVLSLTPSALAVLGPTAAPRVEQVIVGGESCPAELAARWAGRCRFFNTYGPTEATIVTTYVEYRDGALPPLIGRPLPNVRVYLLDGTLQPVPVGVAGELYIGGIGVARGYLARPELSAERFVPDPFCGIPGALMYRSGDFARWRVDGQIEFIGRIDDQVKLRGFRIELGEIEAALARHTQVQACAVIAREDTPGERRLVAYLVLRGGEAPTVSALREHLKRSLADYMVPAAFVVMESLPLTPNNKVDRKALPLPEGAAYTARDYEVPVGAVENTLAQIWAEVLKHQAVGRNDNFFELGGHSLLAMSVIERMRRKGLHADVRALFVAPNLAALAAAVGGDSGIVEVPVNRIPKACAAITPAMVPLVQLTSEHIERIAAAVPGGAANIQDIYPLAPLQEGILFHHLMATEGDPYVGSTLIAFDSRATVERYLEALQAVIDRHDILRTAVLWEGMPEPVQVVWRQAKLAIEEVNVDPESGDVSQQLAARFDSRHFRLDIRVAPMMRECIAYDARNKRWLVLELDHHLLGDHVTQDVMREEILAHLLDKAEQLPAPIPFRNFVAQTRLGVRREEHETFFRKMLGDVDEPTAPFGLTNVHGDSSGIGEARRRVDARLAKRMRERARFLGLSVASLSHLAWALVLARVSGRDDVVFGTVMSGRMHAGEGYDRALGLFMNTLPIRIRICEDGVQESIRRTHALLTEMLRHEHAPLGLAQRCSTVAAPAPLFSALLNYRHSSAAGQLPMEASLGMEYLGAEERTNYPFVLSVDDLGEGFALTAQVQSPVDPQRICAYMHTALEQLLGALESAPATSMRSLDVLPDSERRQLLVEMNRTEVVFEGDMRLHRLFEEQAARTPLAEALVSVDERLSYDELNRRANRLAHQLRALGAKPETLVAVCLQRSSDLIVALFAVLKSGAAYVPLDPEYPAERIAFMIKDSQAAVLITTSDIASGLPPSEAQRLYLDQNGSGGTYRDTNPEGGAAPEHLAYVIYTSGSTGVPKGVAIEHRNAATLVHWARTVFTDSELRGVLASTSVCFDLSIFELFFPLAFGGRVILAENALHLPELPAREEVTLVNTVPSAAAELVRMNALPGSVTTVCLAGEPLPTRLVDQLYDTGTVQRVYDLYGPSEDTTYSTYTLRKPGVPPTIGRPITNTRAYVLDAHMNPVPLGVPGELYLGGAGLARGYLGRPELTRERFLQDPFLGGAQHRVYRTGDLVRYRPDGQLEYLGRLDHQVKVRGFRIELGEIETGIARHPVIREVAVIVREDAPGDKRLVAYLVAENPPADLVDQLRALIRTTMPEYMLPAHFVTLEALPRTPNGKVDRKALPAPELSRSSAGPSYAAPRTPTENTLAQIWSAVLRIDRVGIHDHFFELGGDSILSIQVIARCRQAGLQLTPRDLFKRPTIAQLAQACAQTPVEAPTAQEPLGGTVQLTPIQRWFLEQDFTDPHHWNQAFVFELPADVDLSALEQALHCVLRHHDALRLRLRPAGTGWVQEYAPDSALPTLSRIDLAGIAAEERAAAVEEQATRVQSSLHLEEGCLLRAVYFAFGAGERGRLLLVIHHLAVDGVSWRLISEDLESAYSSLKAGKRPVLAPKTTSYQAWAARLADFARSATPRRSLPFWLAEANAPVSALPAERNDCENLEAAARSVKTRLAVEDTRALLQRVPTTYRTQVNDVLLTALARALQRWTGGEAFRIDLEGHGREDLFDDVDVSRTVGWFTTLFPVRLELPAGLDEGQALKSVKEQLRRVPDRGLSYGLLRYACDDGQTRAALSQSPRSQLVFNYLGQFDQVVAGSNLLSFAPESTGPYHSPAARRTHALEVLCLVRAGELETEWTYHPGIHRRETIERVAQDFLAALRAIIAHCLAAHAGGRTPSDFPLAVLTQDVVDRLWARYPGFEDVYPLSPMQRLFYVAESAHADLEYEPWHFRLDGAIDAGLLRRAIERVVERHSILRTAFAAEISAEPLQVVLREVPVPWSEEDWRGLPAAEQEARLAALLQSQRRTRFDLAQPPLMRMALRRTGDETYHLVWSTHHLHIDGWSWPLIFGEVSKVYEALRQGSEPQLEPPYAYRSYVAWLHGEAPDSEVFWKETLAGFEAPTPLNLTAPPSGPQPRASRFAGESTCLDRDTTAALQSLARSQRITLSTIVQAAWALLLSHYSGSRDVLFGAAFSGRPVEVPGIESLVGPCVTNLPVRVSVAPQDSLLPWLLSLQQRQFELAHHQHAALEQIQTWANLPWQYRLFDSLIVFQNYQVDEAARRIGEDARVVPISGPGSTSYPLTIMVVPEGELQLQFICQPGEFAPDVVRTYATDLAAILHAMAQRPDQALAELLTGLPPSSRAKAAATAARKATGATPIGTAVAPRTPSEELVIGVFRDLLDRADLGVFDDFFDLGGNSVAAAQLMSRLRAASGFDLPLRNLFERPTVAGLAEAIDGLAWVAKSKAPTSGAGRREEIEL